MTEPPQILLLMEREGAQVRMKSAFVTQTTCWVGHEGIN